MPSPFPTSPERTSEFVRLFAAHNRQLYGFVRTLIFNAADADEVFQETCEVLWTKFCEYQSGTNFFAWACKIARFEALEMRRRRGYEARLFSDSFYEAIEQTALETSDALVTQHATLAECIEELSPRQQQIIKLRYASRATTDEVAQKLGRTANAIYKSLQRIHDALLDCAKRKTSQGVQ